MKLARWLIILLFIGIVAGGILYLLRFHSAKAIFPICGEYIKVENTRLYITVCGEGRTVLFLHGFPYHSDSFYSIATRPLPGYRFITMDFPGLGLSEKALNKAVSPDALALLVKLFLDKISVKEVDLVGHDLGGGVAIVCAALFPQMVKRLVLIAPDSSAGSAMTAMNGLWRIPVIGEIWATFRLDRGFIRDWLRKSWAPESTTWNQVVERYIRPLNTANGRKGFLSLHRGCSNFDYLRYEERLQADCLIIWGEEDQILSAARAKRLLQSLSHSQLKLLSGVGHLPQEEVPEKVYQLIKTFLQSSDQDSTAQ